MTEDNNGASQEGKKPASAGPNPVLIKKYPNRRLYNTATSSYIVLDDIVELVKADTPFIVQDKKTGQDITREILNQIMFEQEASHNNYHFPLDVQKQLIRMYGDAYGTMVPDYLRESMNLFVSERNRMSEEMGNLMNRNSQAMFEFSQSMAQKNFEMFQNSWRMFSSMGESSKNAGERDRSAETASKEDLEKLQAELDALQKRLKSFK
ncbi:MAG: polyhydroxyalkanoate synthesis repressor PhaR [Pseudomonadota bacterium]